jgi:hypothetical protein
MKQMAEIEERLLTITLHGQVSQAHFRPTAKAFSLGPFVPTKLTNGSLTGQITVKLRIEAPGFYQYN